ncbi:MAG: caspase family protein, partial [Actinomycetota bacterium]|nr:caspase family protein [Actinomycetota bacterium]
MRLADPTRSQVVLIGAAHFDDPNLNDLPSVRNNVQDLHRILTDPTRGGLTAASCHVFADPRSPDVVRIADIAERAEDVLLIYYSGHGLISENGRLLFALSDTSERHREINALHLNQLRAIFRASPAAVQVLVLDCCYSGRITDPGFMSGPVELVEIEGTYTLASSARDEVSLAPRGARYTAFSGELISLLHNGVTGGEELISLRTVYQQLQIALRKKNFPAPRQLHSETAASLALACNVAFDARVQAPPPPPQEVAPLTHDLLTVPKLEQDVHGLGRQVRDRRLDLNLRMDAVDALVESGVDAAGELADLVRDQDLPILMRLRLMHELGVLPGHRENAAAALSALTGHPYRL